MKSKYISRLLLAGSTAALGLGINGMADQAHASTQGTIQLSGTVQTNCNITITPTSSAGSLVLTSTTSSTINVASVTESCNDPHGYTINLSSQNNTTQGGSNFVGVLKGALSGNTDSVSYNVAYGSSTSTVPSSGVAESVSSKNIAGTSNNVFVAFTGSSSLGADTYTDVLTVTLTTKP